MTITEIETEEKKEGVTRVTISTEHEIITTNLIRMTIEGDSIITCPIS